MLPLHFACGPHGEAIVPMLLQYSPEWQVVQMSAWDQIPLIHACYHGSIGVVRLLLQYQPEHQMDLGPVRENGEACIILLIHMTCSNGH